MPASSFGRCTTKTALACSSPGCAAAPGYRVYEKRDLDRLEQIVALKFRGIPLKQIRTLLEGETVRLADALAIQLQLLQAKQRMLTPAIQAISEAVACVRTSGCAGSAALGKIIEVMEMENNNDWMKKYHTEESQTKVEARKHLWSPELQERVSRDWNELIDEVDISLNEDPAGEKAQNLSPRWKTLVEGFTGGDPDITASVGRMWQDREGWPHGTAQTGPVITPQACAFISKAMAAGKTG